MSNNQNLKFEEAITELDKIVDRLENGDLTIDSAIDEFKKGIKLYNDCYKKIEEAEGKIKIILENEDGTIEENNFMNID